MKVIDIKIKDIIEEYNPSRQIDIEKGVAGLMNTIKQQGLLHPIGVVKKKNKYVCVFGHRRLIACKKLGMVFIPASILDNNNQIESDFIIQNISENLNREDPSFVELGKAFDHLIEQGLNTAEISSKTGQPEARVKSCLKNYKSIPEKYVSKVMIKDLGNKRFDKTKIGMLNLDWITKLQKQSVNGLNPKQKEDLFDLVYKNELTTRQLNLVSYLIKQDLDVKEAIKQLDKYELININFVINKSEFNKFKPKYSSASEMLEDIILSVNDKIILKIRKNKVVV